MESNEDDSGGDFKNQCLEVLEEVAGSREEVVVTRDGKAVARVVPVEQEFPKLFGRMKGTIEIKGDIIGPTGEVWNADLPE